MDRAVQVHLLSGEVQDNTEMFNFFKAFVEWVLFWMQYLQSQRPCVLLCSPLRPQDIQMPVSARVADIFQRLGIQENEKSEAHGMWVKRSQARYPGRWLLVDTGCGLLRVKWTVRSTNPVVSKHGNGTLHIVTGKIINKRVISIYKSEDHQQKTKVSIVKSWDHPPFSKGSRFLFPMQVLSELISARPKWITG